MKTGKREQQDGERAGALEDSSERREHTTKSSAQPARHGNPPRRTSRSIRDLKPVPGIHLRENRSALVAHCRAIGDSGFVIFSVDVKAVLVNTAALELSRWRGGR